MFTQVLKWQGHKVTLYDHRMLLSLTSTQLMRANLCEISVHRVLEEKFLCRDTARRVDADSLTSVKPCFDTLGNFRVEAGINVVNLTLKLTSHQY